MLPLAVLMSRDIKTVPHDATLQEASRLMRDQAVGSLLVTRGSRYVGILSESDLIRRGIAEQSDPARTTVESIMSHPIVTLDIGRTAEDANYLMSERGIRHLAITEQGEVVGIISVRDLLVYFKNRF